MEIIHDLMEHILLKQTEMLDSQEGGFLRVFLPREIEIKTKKL